MYNIRIIIPPIVLPILHWVITNWPIRLVAVSYFNWPIRLLHLPVTVPPPGPPLALWPPFWAPSPQAAEQPQSCCLRRRGLAPTIGHSPCVAVSAIKHSSIYLARTENNTYLTYTKYSILFHNNFHFYLSFDNCKSWL